MQIKLFSSAPAKNMLCWTALLQDLKALITTYSEDRKYSMNQTQLTTTNKQFKRIIPMAALTYRET